ncbi:unnamed protein product [Ceratitis capitata]|uniref:(Mediterranean fruit fly) hypothetical protein n=1 Tax=Ceratitis capitata TaxID=7213 RepID=A0A811V552_CERCA|nr:unnamed protein product [Ceratitis capitata]
MLCGTCSAAGCLPASVVHCQCQSTCLQSTLVWFFALKEEEELQNMLASFCVYRQVNLNEIDVNFIACKIGRRQHLERYKLLDAEIVEAADEDDFNTSDNDNDDNQNNQFLETQDIDSSVSGSQQYFFLQAASWPQPQPQQSSKGSRS